MPYDPPKNDTSLPGGSPFRVFIRDGLPGDPLHQSLSSEIAGLPSKWKEMPTLASAIHIVDKRNDYDLFTSLWTTSTLS